MGYAPNGARQRGLGDIPQTILAQTVEIGRDEAESLVSAWHARVQEVASIKETSRGAPAGPTVPPASPAPPPTAPTPPRNPIRRFWVAGAAFLIVLAVVLATLALTGNLGIEGDKRTSGPGSTGPGTTATTVGDPDDVLATVAGIPITRRQLEQRIADFAAQYPDQIPDRETALQSYSEFERGVLDYLVTYRLASREAAALGIAVTDQDVEAEMALILGSTYSGDQAAFEAAIEQQGLTLEQFERVYAESLLLNRVYAAVTKNVTAAGDDLTLLETTRKQFWADWISQQKRTAGVTYAEGWATPEPADVTTS